MIFRCPCCNRRHFATKCPFVQAQVDLLAAIAKAIEAAKAKPAAEQEERT